MNKLCLSISAVVFLMMLSGGVCAGGQAEFRYPCHLLDAYNPNDDCWRGMDADGAWPRPVVPEIWLSGAPPSELSGVSLETDHWVEVQFSGRIVDGSGYDIRLIESGQCGEQALVFITDGAGQEYLLDIATALSSQQDIPTEIYLDISGVSLAFIPRAIRIVSVDSGGGVPGFDICNVLARTLIDCNETASNPYPVDGAGNVYPDTVLSWLPGCTAEEHVVYFGSSLADVALDAVPVLSPSQPQDANSYDPPVLELGRRYYWRVDEVTQDDAVVTGDVWSFRMVDHLVVDNFELYNRNNNTLPSTWIGFESTFTNLSAKPDPIHRCLQAMKIGYYINVDYPSEAVRTFDVPQNWVSAGAKVLELFFRGESDNETYGQIYAALSDATEKAYFYYDGEPNDIRTQAWLPWRIDLTGAGGLDLSAIESISVGTRIRPDGPSGPAWDNIYIDDIRLYSSMCLEQNRPDADFNCDCTVDYEDLDELAYSWLETGYNVYPASEPNEPVAWYRFDGDTTDSAGGAHGTAYGGPAYVTGVYDRAIKFDGSADEYVEIENATGLFDQITDAITIVFWQCGTDSPHHTDTICCSNYEYGVQNPTIAINLGCWRSPGRYNWDCGYPWSFDNRLSGSHRYSTEWQGWWNHWAFTKDTRTGVMRIFLNGRPYADRTCSTSPISAITSFRIGSGWYGGYDGKLDDFRIYDYALDQAEVVYAATNGTGVFDQAVMSPADLHPDDRINLPDFAYLADRWLEDRLWP